MTYLSDDELKGILTPKQVAASTKSLTLYSSTGKDAAIKDLVKNYKDLYAISQKQMKLFLQEFKISSKKSEILNSMNMCIHKYNKLNFDQNED